MVVARDGITDSIVIMGIVPTLMYLLPAQADPKCAKGIRSPFSIFLVEFGGSISK